MDPLGYTLGLRHYFTNSTHVSDIVMLPTPTYVPAASVGTCWDHHGDQVAVSALQLLLCLSVADQISMQKKVD